LLGTINDDGLSFISDISEASLISLSMQIFLLRLMRVIWLVWRMSLFRIIIMMRIYGFLMKSLDLIEEKIDMLVVTYIFELQVMSRFGAQLDFGQCVFVIVRTCQWIFLINLMVVSVEIILMRGYEAFAHLTLM
jgi:DNA repair protein RecO (recombination protein O)